ncbi:uncharacterized protein LOC127288703 isoform X2 [Leptopilina boulardi]|nr:uncharacterized protein LOC127288703 isoform X2 [Leptopilina boulardi]XP_051172276.1 uncharacterized protein LOC127288703 isoform X2 [Leptopilina boulardi]
MGTPRIVEFAKIFFENTKSSATFGRCLKNVKLISAEGGNCKAEFTVDEEHTNLGGSLHGGFTSTLIDCITTYALVSQGSGNPGVSVNLNVSFMKAAFPGDNLIIDARTIRSGKTLAYLEAELKMKEGGAIVARGQHTKFIAISDIKNQMTEFESQMVDGKEIESEQSKLNSDLNVVMASVKNEIYENSRRLNLLEPFVDSQSKSLKNIKKEMKELKSKMNSFEIDFNKEKQTSLCTSLEICGIPEKLNEDVYKIFIDICHNLGVEINKNDILTISRFNKAYSRTSTAFKSILFVKLSRADLKNELIEQRKKYKYFSTIDIGWGSEEKFPIYIHSAFSPLNRKIFTTACSLMRENKIKSVWRSKGIVHCRQENDSPIIQLRSLDDVNKIK